MSRESDLLFAVLGLKMDFLTRDQVAECRALQASDRRKSLASIIEAKGYLKPAAKSALKALIKARIEKYGDAQKSLEALEIGEDVREMPADSRLGDAGGTLLRWKGGENEEGATPGDNLKEAFATGAKTVVDTPVLPQGSEALKSLGLRSMGGEKYEFGAELGRGGLGRVVEAVDRDFGRKVAVKMMLPGQSPSAVERFLFEGRAAGRLSHPNIVPIHEIGVLAQPGHGAGGRGQGFPYFTMTKIAGRDLGKILHAVEHGFFDSDSPDAASRQTDTPDYARYAPAEADKNKVNPDRANPRKEYTRHRLLAIFQDVCNAVAYAHAHGVLHRDLKPANVMIGNYGEVYVVDWGLAKILTGTDSPDPPSLFMTKWGASAETDSPDSAEPTAHRSPLTAHESPVLTIEGTVMGTPAYMPPEQAEGKISEIDQRSDIYSLGAILYEILTFRPPFEGRTAHEVIAKVLEGTVTPPSSRVSETRASMSSESVQTLPSMEDVPPELDEVVLRALSREKKHRYSSVRELHDEIQLFLEGEKQREYNHRMSAAKVSEGRALVKDMEDARAEMKALEAEVEEKAKNIKLFWPVEKKEEYWGLKDRIKELKERIALSFATAGRAFHAALEFERENADARAAMTDLYWAQYLREEEAGNRAEMIQCEALVREYNDGQYDARLKGDGTLAITTRHYPCRCLTEGRWVDPEELVGERVEGLGSRVELADNNYEEVYQKLPGSDRLAERDGLGRQDVRGDGKHACEGDVRADVADEKSSGVGAEQHSGGACEEKGELFRDTSGHGTGVAGGTGHAAGNMPAKEIHKGGDRKVHAGGDRGTTEDGDVASGKDRDPELNPRPSPLDPSKCGVMGYHPMSGRALDGRKGAEGLSDLEPREPVLLTVHGAECMPEALEGAQAWLFRHEERKKILMPVFPDGLIVDGSARRTIPDPVLDGCFDSRSPFRPGEGLLLGRTPVDKFAIPMGSYLLILYKEGYHPVRCPVSIGRCADVAQDVTMFRTGEIPKGFVQVPAGTFIFQGDTGNPYSGPKEIRETGDFFLAKFPVTCREYLEFLNDLAAGNPQEAAKRVPRESLNAGFYWPSGAEGRYIIPGAAWLAEAPAETRAMARRLAQSPADWEEDWPVYGVSWEDCMSYAAWRSRRSGIAVCLPHEVMREKSARGTDARLYSMGNHFDATYSNIMESHDGPARPCPVDTFPLDESPYGARGLVGNSTEWCINDVEEGKRRLLRGGSWLVFGMHNRATTRFANPPINVYRNYGFRLSALCVLR